MEEIHAGHPGSGHTANVGEWGTRERLGGKDRRVRHGGGGRMVRRQQDGAGATRREGVYVSGDNGDSGGRGRGWGSFGVGTMRHSSPRQSRSNTEHKRPDVPPMATQVVDKGEASGADGRKAKKTNVGARPQWRGRQRGGGQKSKT